MNITDDTVVPNYIEQELRITKGNNIMFFSID